MKKMFLCLLIVFIANAQIKSMLLKRFTTASKQKYNKAKKNRRSYSKMEEVFLKNGKRVPKALVPVTMINLKSMIETTMRSKELPDSLVWYDLVYTHIERGYRSPYQENYETMKKFGFDFDGSSAPLDIAVSATVLDKEGVPIGLQNPIVIN